MCEHTGPTRVCADDSHPRRASAELWHVPAAHHSPSGSLDSKVASTSSCEVRSTVSAGCAPTQQHYRRTDLDLVDSLTSIIAASRYFFTFRTIFTAQ